MLYKIAKHFFDPEKKNWFVLGLVLNSLAALGVTHASIAKISFSYVTRMSAYGLESLPDQ